MKKIIFLASDHAGFKLKEKIKNHLEKKGFQIHDEGTFSTKPVDYSDFIIPAVRKAIKSKVPAIVLGGTGQGEAIAANKVKGARATVLYNFNKKIIKLSKQHNNANVLSLGARLLSEKQAIQSIELWLRTPFSNEMRHKKRISKLK